MTYDNPSKSNVIPFPELERHLLNKGKDFLNQGKIKEAIQFLQESRLLDDENPETLQTLTAAYMQLGNFQKAKGLLEEMIGLEIGDYFETTELYISVLFQLHEYKKIKTMLTMLLEDGHVPPEKIDQYNELLLLSMKLADENIEGTVKPENLFEGDTAKIIENITNLDHEGMLFHLSDIQSYLKDEGTDSFIKTVLLNTLKEQQVEEEVEVVKFNETVCYQVTDYFLVQDAPFPALVKQQLEKVLIDENPVMLEYSNTICDRFFFMIYPLEINYKEPELWAMAILSVVESYFGQKIVEDVIPDSILNREEFKKAKQLILEVEKHLAL